MPTYPSTLADAQGVASKIAQSNNADFRCVECAEAICRAIGPIADAYAVKVVTNEGKGIVTYPNEDRLVATTGQHVGIRIGDIIYDNLHPAGLPANLWPGLYRDRKGDPLNCYHRSLSDFFGKIFRWQEFARFASNRFQQDEFEWNLEDQSP